MCDEYHILAHQCELLDEVHEHGLADSITLERKAAITHRHLRIILDDVCSHIVKHLAHCVNHDSLDLRHLIRNLLECDVSIFPACRLKGRNLMRSVDALNTAIIIEQYCIRSRYSESGLADTRLSVDKN